MQTVTASPHKSGPASSSLANDGSAEHIIRVNLEATRSAAYFFSGAEFALRQHDTRQAGRGPTAHGGPVSQPTRSLPAAQPCSQTHERARVDRCSTVRVTDLKLLKSQALRPTMLRRPMVQAAPRRLARPPAIPT